MNNKDYGNENDNSSVIYTELNDYKFLFMGDAGIEVEEDLIEKYNLQDIDVLKVGHHGSRTSSSKNFIDEYSQKLIVDVGKKYNRRTLFRMKKFYSVFSNEKVATMLTQLTWSHYLLLLPINDYDEIIYYINISKNNNLTQRQLQDKIKSKEYQRIPIETKNKLILDDEIEVKDLVPYIN